MDTQIVPLKVSARQFAKAAGDLANSEVGSKAKWMLAGLVGLLCAVNGLNVVNSFVGRNFMTSIADKNQAEFIRQAMFYIGVFAASTFISVSARFAEDRIGLLWREFLSRRAVKFYLADNTYY